MIDRISPSRISAPGIADARAARASLPASVDRVRAAEEPASSLVSEPRRMAAEGPPIDAGRVDRLRSAIADGSYAIDAERIAAAMMASEHIA